MPGVLTYWRGQYLGYRYTGFRRWLSSAVAVSRLRPAARNAALVMRFAWLSLNILQFQPTMNWANCRIAEHGTNPDRVLARHNGTIDMGCYEAEA